MKVIIAGSRDIEDFDLVVQAVEDSGFEITEVVSGKARGIDSLGEKWALENDIPVKEFPAAWRVDGRYNPNAGPERNIQMARYADALIAITYGSSGTSHMIKVAKMQGLQVHILMVGK